MIPEVRRLSEFEIRNLAFDKYVKEFDTEFNRVMKGTVELSRKIKTFVHEMRGTEQTFTKQKIQKLTKLMKTVTAYVDFRKDVYKENIAIQSYLSEYYDKVKVHFVTKDISLKSLKRIADAAEVLEKRYEPEAKRMMKVNSGKLPLILQKHEEVRKLYSAFEI